MLKLRDNDPKDASQECYLDWWDGNNHHVVKGTKNSIDNLKTIILKLINDFDTQEIMDTIESLSMSCNDPITHVAIKSDFDGTVYKLPKPNRHPHIIAMLIGKGFPAPIKGTQGFVTESGIFMDRETAACY
jgi:hypothetical protein